MEFAHYWMHNAFLNIDNRKMSKSLGNFFTVRDISEKYDLQVLRFFMLSAHYRSPLNFSAELMEAAKNGLERILNAASALRDYVIKAQAADGTYESPEQFRAKFEAAMDDDFNTADAISAVFELVKYANTRVASGCGKDEAESLLSLLEELCGVLGINTEPVEASLDAEVEALIKERQAARAEKNWAKADEIRDRLTGMGIILEDTKDGVKWKKA